MPAMAAVAWNLLAEVHQDPPGQATPRLRELEHLPHAGDLPILAPLEPLGQHLEEPADIRVGLEQAVAQADAAHLEDDLALLLQVVQRPGDPHARFAEDAGRRRDVEGLPGPAGSGLAEQLSQE